MAGSMIGKSKRKKNTASKQKVNKLSKLISQMEEEAEQKGEARIEFEAWCKAKGFDPDKPRSGYLEDFILQKQLQTWDIDPPEYPGLNHAASICLFKDYYEDRHFRDLSRHNQESLHEWLNKKYAQQHMGDRFEIGKIIGGRWKIISSLSGATGFFNRGIFVVKDETNHTSNQKAIMKLLPTEAMQKGYARREIMILASLKHANILQLYDSHIPDHIHETAWMVTEFCEHKTLKDLVASYEARNQMVPELFVWQVFESLARAIQYCHHGRPSCEVWDKVSHRDITAFNVFIKSTSTRQADEYPYSIKVGDFGCAITDSEWTNKDLNMTLYDLPLIDCMYEAPEGTAPSESADVYQIGVIMWCFFCLASTPDAELSTLASQKCRPGHRRYSKELRDLIIACLDVKSEKRPSASTLAKTLRAKRRVLLADGTMKFERITFQ
jgi:serine/threonine protein kinase